MGVASDITRIAILEQTPTSLGSYSFSSPSSAMIPEP